MLKIIQKPKDLSFEQLMQVYSESNRINGLTPEQLLRTEEECYRYFCEFLKDKDSFCAVWELDGCYKAVLRFEAYRDGYLITGLETAPEERRKGYAGSLMMDTLEFMKAQGMKPVYSHVEKRNTASYKLHLKCGFQKLYDYAVYLDGTVTRNSDTLYFL